MSASDGVDDKPAEPEAEPTPAQAAAAPPPAAGERQGKRDPALTGAVKAAAVSALALTALMAALVEPTFAIGTFFGGALATVNLILFIRLGEAWLAQKGNSAPWGLLGALKLLGLFACVAIILRQGAVSALAFVIGYGALPIGIALSSLFRGKPAD